MRRGNLPDTEEVTAWHERRPVFGVNTLATITISGQFHRHKRPQVEVRGLSLARVPAAVHN